MTRVRVIPYQKTTIQKYYDFFCALRARVLQGGCTSLDDLYTAHSVSSYLGTFLRHKGWIRKPHGPKGPNEWVGPKDDAAIKEILLEANEYVREKNRRKKKRKTIKGMDLSFLDETEPGRPSPDEKPCQDAAVGSDVAEIVALWGVMEKMLARIDVMDKTVAEVAKKSNETNALVRALCKAWDLGVEP